MSKKRGEKKRKWLLDGRWVRKRTRRGWAERSPAAAVLCQAQNEQNSCKQSQAVSQVLIKHLLKIFFCNSLQNLSSGLWSWNWREPFLFLFSFFPFSKYSCFASPHLHYPEISGHLWGCCYQKWVVFSRNSFVSHWNKDQVDTSGRWEPLSASTCPFIFCKFLSAFAWPGSFTVL